MSFEATRWAYSLRGLDAKCKSTLVCLAFHANDLGEAWPGADGIADETGQSRSTVYDALGELTRRGLIEKTRPGAFTVLVGASPSPGAGQIVQPADSKPEIGVQHTDSKVQQADSGVQHPDSLYENDQESSLNDQTATDLADVRAVVAPELPAGTYRQEITSPQGKSKRWAYVLDPTKCDHDSCAASLERCRALAEKHGRHNPVWVATVYAVRCCQAGTPVTIDYSRMARICQTLVKQIDAPWEEIYHVYATMPLKSWLCRQGKPETGLKAEEYRKLVADARRRGDVRGKEDDEWVRTVAAASWQD